MDSSAPAAQKPISGCFHLRSVSGPPHRLLRLLSGRVYTVGRNSRGCDIAVHGDRSISRRHCQFFLNDSVRRLWVMDGFSLSGDSTPVSRASLNGVFVNGRRLRKGGDTELVVGDEVLFGCGGRLGCASRARYGFVVERIDFSAAVAGSTEDADQVLDEIAHRDCSLPCAKAAFLMKQCTRILQAEDPVSYLRNRLDSDPHQYILASGLGPEKANNDDDLEPMCSRNTGNFSVGNDEHIEPSVFVGEDEQSIGLSHSPEAASGLDCESDGTTFYLNRLEFMGPGGPDQHAGVTLPELLHPVQSLVRVFIATFTCDISWFLSYCQVPRSLPITVACHNAERCWSARPDSRTSAPYSDFPNLLLVYPPFPDVIAFGKDRKRQGVACHHPKLFVLQREDMIRIVVTSANLVSKQWNHVTNTVWWQDFPLRHTPDYSGLFGRIGKSDFAAQLAGFIATLITDVPSQAYWITELTKYDFGGALGHLVASVPGLHAQNYFGTGHFLSAKQIVCSQFRDKKILGSIEASVAGLSHHFCSKTDSNGAQLKTLASILGKYQDNSTCLLEVLLKRNIKIPADANAVSVIVSDLDEYSEAGCVHLGFLPRDVAKWVSPLYDVGFFSFFAFLYPKETLAAALGGSNMKVHLLLFITEGPRFHEISSLIQPAHLAPLSSLLASLQRSLGLWRLQEVLSLYKWPESLETDFIYGSSSVGTSISAQFIASFSTSAGKRTFQFSESEESDPEWGCWNKTLELRNPSLRILFPTIDRVKNGVYGIQFSRRMLSFSEKTWQRLRSSSILHDAIPHPDNRSGYPMHVKIARRRFQSKTSGSSFGWIYCGSHNFSAAAWGHTIFPSSEQKVLGEASVANDLCPRLHICNYELGVLLIVPPPNESGRTDGRRFDLDDIVLPFVMPAPKYQGNDRPATAQAMREALNALAVLQSNIPLAAVHAEEMDEDISDEEDEMLEASAYVAEEKEETRVYAEMLWSQVDSSES